ncbi:hypothetical protein [Nocardia sp. CA-290969]|uniref:hypothetical protein n=1 Tax=Nocardia sp. CA-290969 TaxID=3239986 RepID=UPI003D8B80F2
MAAAARVVSNLVVVTADETRGRRAQLARHALNLLDRNDVAVIIPGFDLGGEDRFLLDTDYLSPEHEEDFLEHIRGLDRMIAAVVELCETTTGPIQWGVSLWCSSSR